MGISNRNLIDALNQPSQKQSTKRLFCMDLENNLYESFIKIPRHKDFLLEHIKRMVTEYEIYCEIFYGEKVDTIK